MTISLPPALRHRGHLRRAKELVRRLGGRQRGRLLHVGHTSARHHALTMRRRVVGALSWEDCLIEKKVEANVCKGLRL